MTIQRYFLGVLLLCVHMACNTTLPDAPPVQHHETISTTKDTIVEVFQDTMLSTEQPIDSNNSTVVEMPQGQSITLWATYYYIPKLQHQEKGIPLLDKNKQYLGYSLDSCDWCKASIEGTVLIEKNTKWQLFNFFKRSDELQYDCRLCERYQNYEGYEKTGKVLWSKANGFGKGIAPFHLVPFKTIAVDKTVIPYGSAIFIETAKGILYMDENGQSQKHDGLFFAGDTGSQIIGKHIDVFLGFEQQNPFNFIHSDSNKTFDAVIITNEDTIHQLKRLHLSYK